LPSLQLVSNSESDLKNSHLCLPNVQSIGSCPGLSMHSLMYQRSSLVNSKFPALKLLRMN
jgi:hypothetical protein